jgi:hypothetical protein
MDWLRPCSAAAAPLSGRTRSGVQVAQHLAELPVNPLEMGRVLGHGPAGELTQPRKGRINSRFPGDGSTAILLIGSGRLR